MKSLRLKRYSFPARPLAARAAHCTKKPYAPPAISTKASQRLKRRLPSLNSLPQKTLSQVITSKPCRLKEFDGEAKLAFKEPFRKPSADPSKAPIVKSVLIDDVFNHGFRFPDGKAVAEFDSIVRTDVFTKNGKFYCVPIYTSAKQSNYSSKAI